MWRIIIVLCALGATAAQAADNRDWGLEQRYKAQLILAKQGNKEAQYDVGIMYEKGRGVDRNPRKAVHWLGEAARQGHATAMAELGIIYFEGNGVSPDYAKAFSLLSSASTQHIPSAEFYLGRIYEQGKGTRRNLNVALQWYRRAAKDGYYPARGKIAELQARIQAAQAQQAAAAAPRPATTSRPVPVAPVAKPATRQLAGTRGALLAAHWARNQRPAGYLPSSLTTCKAGPQDSLTCVSQTQQRSTGQAMISYRTRATLSDFGSGGHFRIRYTNEIVNITPIKREGAAATDVPQVAQPRLRKEAEHSLVCTLDTGQSINCTKDKIFKLHFTTQQPVSAARNTDHKG